MKKIDIDKLEVSSKLDDVINSAVSEGYKNIDAKAKKKSTNNKIKKSIIAASLAIGVITTGVVTTPAIAANIPIIGDIYRQLGFFDGFEDYTSYIGETKEVDGCKFTIDNIVGTPTDLMVGVKIESPVPFGENIYENILGIDVDIEQFGMKGMSGAVSPYYLDKNTVIVTSHMKSVEGKFKEKGNMKITAHCTLGDGKEVRTDFDIKVDFTSSFNKIETIKVNEAINDLVKVEEIKSSVIGTKIVFGPNAKGTNIEGREIWDGGNDTLYLEVDGQLHGSYSTSSIDDVSMHDFPTVKYDDIKSAENINLLYLYNSKFSGEEFNGEIEMETENNITYPKSIVTEDGMNGGFYKIEKENNTVKAYFKSDYDVLSSLNSFALFELDENGRTIRINNPKACKNNDGSYIFEFNNINFNNELLIPSYSGIPLNKSYDIKTIKIK